MFILKKEPVVCVFICEKKKFKLVMTQRWKEKQGLIVKLGCESNAKPCSLQFKVVGGRTFFLAVGVGCGESAVGVRLILWVCSFVIFMTHRRQTDVPKA